MQGKQYVQGAPDGDMDDFYVTDGKITSKGVQPSEYHTFNYSTGKWALDIELGRRRKWQEIKEKRQTEEFSAFTWNDLNIQCDVASQARINAAVQSAIIDNTFSTTWTLSDNSTKLLNATEIKSMGQALADHIKACHERGRLLRAEINTAKTLKGLEAVSW